MTSIVLTHYRPHKPTSGASLRIWQNIKALASFGPVDVVTVGVDDAGEPVESVREWTPFPLASRSRWDRFRTACAPLRPGVHPGVDLYRSARIAAWLRERRYDVAVIETITMAGYLAELKSAAHRVVFDAHNIEGVLQPELDAAVSRAEAATMERLKQRVLSRRMTSAERRVMTGADLVWTCSDADARQIERRYGRRSGVTVVPNGVDVGAYRLTRAVPLDGDWGRIPITMVYPGLFTYFPNEDAALRLVGEVLPAVRARGFRARAILVGRNPVPSLLAAAAHDDGIEVTGAVESIVPYLNEACVVTLPIAMGSGTRLKIVEAFAAGRPVVSTPKGAEGIEAVDGRHLLIRENAEAIADAVIDLWTTPSLRRGICAGGLELVRSRYSWSAAAERIAASLGLEVDRLQPRAGGRPDQPTVIPQRVLT